jgi:predicted nuclease with TOPRIM domain
VPGNRFDSAETLSKLGDGGARNTLQIQEHVGIDRSVDSVKSCPNNAEEDLHELKTALLQKNEETQACTQRIEEISSELAEMSECAKKLDDLAMGIESLKQLSFNREVRLEEGIGASQCNCH